jgi:hypothetical protein
MLWPALALAASLFGAPAQAEPGAREVPSARWEAAPEQASRPTVQEPTGGWRTEIGLYADVHGPWAEPGVVLRLANHAATALPRLAARLGVRPTGPIDVYLLPSEEAFHAVQPGRTPDWADGTAWPAHGLIFLKSPTIRPGTAAPLEQVLEHELVHVLLGQEFGTRPVPRWLQEGMAQFYAGEATWERAIALARNDFGLEPMPLASITGGFPADPVRAQLAYAQSADFVSWLHARGGEDSLRALVRQLAAGASTSDAVQLAAGLTLEQADAAWRETQPATVGWYRWVTNPALWWGAAAGFLAMAVWRRRTRAQLKLERWDAEERARAEAILRAQEANPRGDPPAMLMWAGSSAASPWPRAGHPAVG